VWRSGLVSRVPTNVAPHVSSRRISALVRMGEVLAQYPRTRKSSDILPKTGMPLLFKILPLTDRLRSRPRAKSALLGDDSQINRAICPSADLPALPGILQDP
jgi:hypothetical protein